MKQTRQAKPTPSAHVKGEASSAASTQAQDVRALLVDIFALTGQKVEIDDPIVAAALIHSTLLRRAGQDAANAIKEAAPRPSGENICWLTMLSVFIFLVGMIAGALSVYMMIPN